MAAVLTINREASLGFRARRLRVARLLTRQELANIAEVSPEEVDLFEHNLPLRLDARRKILKGLWARKAATYSCVQ